MFSPYPHTIFPDEEACTSGEMPVFETSRVLPFQIPSRKPSLRLLSPDYARNGDETMALPVPPPVVVLTPSLQQPLCPGRELSLVEQDIRVKIVAYLQGRFSLADLVSWLNNPLLVWEMLEEVARNPAFGVWISKIHGYCVLFSEQRCPEYEITPLFASILAE